MEIAYIILAHKNPRQLIRLVHRLNTKRTSFFIHIDKKTDDRIYHQVVNGVNSLQNVYFLKRYKCYWAHFSCVKATIEGIYEIFNKNIPFDCVILLTGQDYPIKSNIQIERFLKYNSGKSFLEFFPLPRDNAWLQENGGLDRIQYWHFILFGKNFVIPNRIGLSSFFSFIKRKFPKGFKPFGGSHYWILSRECAEYLYTFLKKNQSFLNFFKYVAVPEEIFFQTVILNSSLKNSVINNNLRYIEWSKEPAPHPKILRKDDFKKLIKSPALFARKFDNAIDADILDMIDKKINEKKLALSD